MRRRVYQNMPTRQLIVFPCQIDFAHCLIQKVGCVIGSRNERATVSLARMRIFDEPLTLPSVSRWRGFMMCECH
jgi:hypothetical protein